MNDITDEQIAALAWRIGMGPAIVSGTDVVGFARAVMALRPAAEPAAWIEHHKGGDNLCWDDPGGKRTPLYAAQQPAPVAQPVAEPEVDIDRSIGCRHGIAGYCTKCNASPQPEPVVQISHAEWLSLPYTQAQVEQVEQVEDLSAKAAPVAQPASEALTPLQIAVINEQYGFSIGFTGYARAIERAHKIGGAA